MTTAHIIMATLWKRAILPPFLKGSRISFLRLKTARRYLDAGRIGEIFAAGDQAVFWGALEAKNPELRRLAQDLVSRGITVIRAEDAFIRSNGLGCNYYYPYSLAFDETGIYYDPCRPSDLESILRHLRERPDYQDLRLRGEKLRDLIIKGGITKYRSGITPKPVPAVTALLRDNPGNYDRVIFIPAQVDNDASVITGGLGYTNISLLRRVRKDNPRALIMVKIHPDVLNGLREGLPEAEELQRLADYIAAPDTGAPDLAEIADEVHTISSLAGFEALLRGKKTVVYGMPFYAGYGLTRDVSIEDVNEIARAAALRRGNSIRDLTDLIIGALLLYPRYYNWDTGAAATAEEIAETLMSHPEGTRYHRVFQGGVRIYAGIMKVWRMLAGRSSRMG
ncbi:beta-3-deoxy-D-manno-oct-2-ulosonic acid transferase [Succinimonas sp.]|uniref:capsular polysaccharide export protein, LipB/KpsS family n=1 Tax=Succinimonas sp. TaxID=1936151 RepID=UPI00386A0F64